MQELVIGNRVRHGWCGVWSFVDHAPRRTRRITDNSGVAIEGARDALYLKKPCSRIPIPHHTCGSGNFQIGTLIDGFGFAVGACATRLHIEIDGVGKPARGIVDVFDARGDLLVVEVEHFTPQFVGVELAQLKQDFFVFHEADIEQVLIARRHLNVDEIVFARPLHTDAALIHHRIAEPTLGHRKIHLVFDVQPKLANKLGLPLKRVKRLDVHFNFKRFAEVREWVFPQERVDVVVVAWHIIDAVPVHRNRLVDQVLNKILFAYDTRMVEVGVNWHYCPCTSAMRWVSPISNLLVFMTNRSACPS